jgi:hypothetical protein
LTIGAAAWWAGQRPYLTPGNHRVFRQDSNAAALAGFLVFIAATVTGGSALMLWINDRKVYDAARAVRVCAVIIVPYLAALVLVSLLTPGTIVNIGDSYCYDLWCLGMNQMNATPKGQDMSTRRRSAFLSIPATLIVYRQSRQMTSSMYSMTGAGANRTVRHRAA